VKVVDKGLKVDLHIHSVYSNHKDGAKVKNNTLENIDNLVDKLVTNDVNICAITDHDTFNYSIYNELKKTENSGNCIKKILPGVEFSVQFSTETVNSVIHIITIFNDNNDDKIKNIENVLKFKNDKPQYDYQDVAFSENKYLSILRDIDVDTIMVAHQKNSLTSEGKPGRNDAFSLGEDKFNEFLFTDYFEAFEFRNKKNEIFNKKYIFNNGVENDLRFITGSDCHDWTVYPKGDSGQKGDFCFTYMKCLPTFRGVVMAITDHRRIKFVNSFFNPTAVNIDNIQLKIKDKEINVPMSRGINVIIGDNSIGKSLLIHKLTNYVKYGDGLTNPIKKGYERYLKENNVQVLSQIPSSQIFHFDMQGQVRKLFEENIISRSDFLGTYFPEKVDPKIYQMKVENELTRFFNDIRQKFIYDELLKKLSMFLINENDQSALSITFLDTLKNNEVEKSQFNSLVTNLGKLNEFIKEMISIDKILEPDDLAILNEFKSKIEAMELKYGNIIKKIELDAKKINVINSFMKIYKEDYEKLVSDEQKIFSDYIENKNAVIQDITDLVIQGMKIQEFNPNIETYTIEPKKNVVFQYEFISKLRINEISNEYINELIQSALKKDKKINTAKVTKEALKNMISFYPSESNQPLDVLKEKINVKLNEDFSNVQSIIFEGMDKFKELSTGLDSQIYFTLLSYEDRNKGIYIIDQPEDDISQKAIRDYLLKRFKTMGENRQVVIITHNPQFIVNLDVDNVIFLTKENGNLTLKSGALEYEDDKYNILQIIADNIDGGLDTIERRLKRYEKGI
jgi:predicted ATPase